MASPTGPPALLSYQLIYDARHESSSNVNNRSASVVPTGRAAKRSSAHPRRVSWTDASISRNGIDNIHTPVCTISDPKHIASKADGTTPGSLNMVLKHTPSSSSPPPPHRPPGLSGAQSGFSRITPVPGVYRDMRGVQIPPPPPPPPPPPAPILQLETQGGVFATVRPPPPPFLTAFPASGSQRANSDVAVPPPPPPPPPPLSSGHLPNGLHTMRPFNSSLVHGNYATPLADSETASEQAPPYSYSSSPSDSEYESDSSEATSTSTYMDGQGREMWASVEAKQRQIWRLRSDMAKKRKELKQRLEGMSDLDNQFMQLIRPYYAIIEQFQRLQAARNEYYPAVSTYNALEKELKTQEVELETMEADVVRVIHEHANSFQPHSLRSFPQGIESNEPRNRNAKFGSVQKAHMDSRASILLGISGERHEDIHPLYRQLLDAAGDRELAREFCEEVKMRHEAILYDLETKLHRKRMKENRGVSISEQELESLKSSLEHIPSGLEDFEAQFGVSISEDDLEFVQNYESEKDRAQTALEKASQTVDRLRDLCIEKHAIPKHASYNEEVTIFSGSSRAPADGNMSIESLPSNNLSHPRFPILLSNPSYVLKLLTPRRALEEAMALPPNTPNSAQRRAECMKELGITNLMKNAESKPDYINQWLIHRLRTSPMEVELMVAVFETSHKIVNARKWQEDVLFHWRRDEAAKMSPSDFEGPHTPRDELDIEQDNISGLNSVIEGPTRSRSEGGNDDAHQRHHNHRIHHHHQSDTWARTVHSVC